MYQGNNIEITLFIQTKVDYPFAFQANLLSLGNIKFVNTNIVTLTGNFVKIVFNNVDKTNEYKFTINSQILHLSHPHIIHHSNFINIYNNILVKANYQYEIEIIETSLLLKLILNLPYKHVQIIWNVKQNDLLDNKMYEISQIPFTTYLNCHNSICSYTFENYNKLQNYIIDFHSNQINNLSPIIIPKSKINIII